MGKLIVDGKEYLINTQLADHVIDKIIADILKWYPQDANVEFIELY